jgi:hypothetical protein
MCDICFKICSIGKLDIFKISVSVEIISERLKKWKIVKFIEICPLLVKDTRKRERTGFPSLKLFIIRLGMY